MLPFSEHSRFEIYVQIGNLLCPRTIECCLKITIPNVPTSERFLPRCEKGKKWSMPFFRPSPFRRHFKCTCETSWYGQFHAHVSWALPLWNKCLNRHYWIVHTHVKSNEAVRTISSEQGKHWAIEGVLNLNPPLPPQRGQIIDFLEVAFKITGIIESYTHMSSQMKLSEPFPLSRANIEQSRESWIWTAHCPHNGVRS